eukprot:TRINITY_DN23016_c0_g1_i1.p1 TRINITY_DN23016_c0_g1~~TRINITY_DN23016_c0_g1_i1.p1  ORF type:complete len:320 (+),score=80.56 TRINITY_DN23016_c0_g1_i1:30-962(+)
MEATNTKRERMEFILKACQVGSGLYAAAVAFNKAAAARLKSDADRSAWAEQKVLLAQVYGLAAAGGGVALLGVGGFLKLPFAPIWLPTMLTSSSLMCYIHLNWETLLLEDNNKNLARNILIAVPLSFFGGWTAGPLAYFFRGKLLKTFVPFSMGAMLGSATACIVSPHPSSLFVHAPLATLAYAGVLFKATNAIEAISTTRAYNKLLFYSVCSSLLVSLHTAYCLVFKPQIDIVSHSLGLMAGGASAFYKMIRDAMRLKAKLARKLLMEKKDDPHDEKAVASCITMGLLGLYYFMIIKVRADTADKYTQN